MKTEDKHTTVLKTLLLAITYILITIIGTILISKSNSVNITSGLILLLVCGVFILTQFEL
jgi:hypothetical protein